MIWSGSEKWDQKKVDVVSKQLAPDQPAKPVVGGGLLIETETGDDTVPSPNLEEAQGRPTPK